MVVARKGEYSSPRVRESRRLSHRTRLCRCCFSFFTFFLFRAHHPRHGWVWLVSSGPWEPPTKATAGSSKICPCLCRFDALFAVRLLTLCGLGSRWFRCYKRRRPTESTMIDDTDLIVCRSVRL